MSNDKINFENIPPDLKCDDSIILWRYMSFASLFDILMNNRIPLIRIKNFADKSEGAILRSILHKIPRFHDQTIEFVMDKYRDLTYVSSWHKAKDENAAMWERYIDGSEGVAIKTNAKLLLDCINENASQYPVTNNQAFSELDEQNPLNPGILIKKVKYTDRNPEDFEMDEINLLNGYDELCFFYKMIDYKDEAEIRILFSRSNRLYELSDMHPTNLHKMDKSMSNLYKSNPPFIHNTPYKESILLNIGSAAKLIQKIVISPRAYDRFIDIVKQLADSANIEECKVVESRQKAWMY